MRKCKYIKEIIIPFIIITILFAITIHILFLVEAPYEWMVAKWSAGDVLTYASTILLGLLALYQNQIFKEENDECQKRLEKLTRQANDLVMINKIIEVEDLRLKKIREDFQTVIIVCNPQKLLADIVETKADKEALLLVLTRIEVEIDSAIIHSHLLIDTGKLIVHYEETIAELFRLCQEIKSFLHNSKQDFEYFSENIDKINHFSKIRDKIVIQFERHMSELENNLQRAIYEKMSLEEIRELFVK